VETGATCRDRFTDVAPRCESLTQLCPSIISRESKPFEGRKWNGHPRRVVESVVHRRERREKKETKKRRSEEKEKEGQQEKSPREVGLPLLNYGYIIVCVVRSRFHSQRFFRAPISVDDAAR
jgi:hypothetical protein